MYIHIYIILYAIYKYSLVILRFVRDPGHFGVLSPEHLDPLRCLSWEKREPDAARKKWRILVKIVISYIYRLYMMLMGLYMGFYLYIVDP